MKSITAKTALVLAFTFSILPFTTKPARAWGKWWEHPFHDIGNYEHSQKTGDGICLAKLIQMRSLPQVREYETTITSNGTIERSHTDRRVVAWDGWDITYADHVWYHRRSGYCVANQDNWW